MRGEGSRADAPAGHAQGARAAAASTAAEPLEPRGESDALHALLTSESASGSASDSEECVDVAFDPALGCYVEVLTGRCFELLV